jgi:Flp pilus assembly protein TadG
MRFDIFRRFAHDKSGNVAMIYGIAAIPLMFAVGMGVDYGNNARKWSQMNAAADAAALAAVTPTMMTQSDTAAKTAAQNMFNGQIANITNIASYTLNVAVADAGLGRTVTVSYTAQVNDVFGGLLHLAAMSVSGSSQASGSSPPNINFYMLLDTSPSMAIAGTSAGISTMVSNTSSQGGCAFACHETNPSADNLGNPHGEDNYALARALGVALRIDLLGQAMTSLVQYAQATEAASTAKYGIAVNTFDVSFKTVAALTTNLTSLSSALSASPSPIQLLQVYQNNWLTKTSNNSDADTNWDAAMTGVNGQMPSPGQGSNANGDSPMEVLFIVTDGVEDETVGGSRVQSLMGTSNCTTIKNRGIRIAILYTEYLPLPTNSWYNTYIAPIQSNIGPTLQNCASPGLYQAVDTGGDISSALANLFETAVATAYLSK